MDIFFKKASFSIVLMLLLTVAYAQKSEVYIQGGKAIKGYDPVSYFTDAKPMKGDDKFILYFEDAYWYFSSQKNLELFKANPKKFMPQYGGYCAFGVAGGDKVPISPDSWSIVDGKLYLNYNKKVQKDWKADQAALIKKADENWPRVKKD